MLVIALVSIPCSAGGFEHIHIAFGICACKVDQRHMSFRFSVGCLDEIRTFFQRDRDRLCRRITVFGCSTAEIAVLKHLVCSSTELRLDKLLVKVAECLIRTVYILKHFVGFVLVCAIGMERNDRCSHRCEHAVVIIALNL